MSHLIADCSVPPFHMVERIFNHQSYNTKGAMKSVCETEVKQRYPVISMK